LYSIFNVKCVCTVKFLLSSRQTEMTGILYNSKTIEGGKLCKTCYERAHVNNASSKVFRPFFDFPSTLKKTLSSTNSSC